MANVWFDQLASLEKAGVDLNEMKDDFKGITLVGEYVGSADH
jgi:hypothetical protein